MKEVTLFYFQSYSPSVLSHEVFKFHSFRYEEGLWSSKYDLPSSHLANTCSVYHILPCIFFFTLYIYEIYSTPEQAAVLCSLCVLLDQR